MEPSSISRRVAPLMSPQHHQTNLAADLERRLSSEALRLLQQVATLAEAEEKSLYLVGGIVRDLIMGWPNHDLDLVLEGDAVALARSLAQGVGGRVVTHRQFGTATVYVNSLAIDLATARTESYPRPGALPQVRPGVITDDLRRRDFTVNAMALSLSPPAYGQLIDPLNGREDLTAGLVRVIHDRSFIDDATRILRAVRYEQRFGFRLEEATESLLRRDVEMLSTISGDRLRHELQRILGEGRPEAVMERAHALGVLQAVHPALRWDRGLSHGFQRAREAGAGTLKVHVGLLTHRLSASELAALAQFLRFSGSWARVAQDAQHLAASLQALEAPGMSRSQLSEALEGYVPEAVRACRIASDSAIIRERLGLYLDELRSVRPLMDGRGLLDLGVSQGPEVGEALAQLRRARLDGQVSTREEETAFVQRWLRGGGSGS